MGRGEEREGGRRNKYCQAPTTPHRTTAARQKEGEGPGRERGDGKGG
eukprot:COSAG02_NODE_66267_length_256_cov_0.522293_1_plen_46_part_01